MTELLIAYQDQIVLFFQNLSRSFISFAIGLSIVYITGRMFNIVKYYKTKNLIAFVTIFLSSYLYGKIYINYDNISTNVEIADAFLYGCYAIILYTILGFKLYSRLDTFLDKYIGEDEKFNENKEIKKKTKKK